MKLSSSAKIQISVVFSIFSVIFLLFFQLLNSPRPKANCESILAKESYSVFSPESPKNCDLKWYKPTEVIQCFDKQPSYETALPVRKKFKWHIAFLGDSRTRLQYYAFCNLFPWHDAKVTGHRNGIKTAARHKHASIYFSLIDTKISYRFQPYPNSDLTEDFIHWTQTAPEEAPDVIIMGQTLWTLHFVDDGLEVFTRNLTLVEPYISKLAKLSKFIWWIQDPVNDIKMTTKYTPQKSPYGQMDNYHLLSYNAVTRKILRDAGVIFWDSTRLLYQENIRSCAAFPVRRDAWGYLACHDYTHSNSRFSYYYAQQLMNYLCNSRMSLSQNHCCAK